MLITGRPGGNCLIEMNAVEKIAIFNSIKFIIDELGEDELETRTGFSIMEYETLCQLISQNVIGIEIGKDGQIMLHQALNEVCHGIHIPQYEKQIGMPILEMRKMLDLIESKCFG